MEKRVVDSDVPDQNELREGAAMEKEVGAAENESIDALRINLDALDEADLRSVQSIMERVGAQRNKLVESLKAASDKAEKNSIIGRKKEIDAIWNRLKTLEIELTKEDPTLKIPREKERERFVQLLAALPSEQLKKKYLGVLEHCLQKPNEVKITTGIQGLIFELTRVEQLQEQKLESVAWDATVNGGKEKYQALDTKAGKDGAVTADIPTVEKPIGMLQLDVPMIRKGDDGVERVFVYETKYMPRMQYGSDIVQRNQVLKYQRAVELGLAAGAAVEVSGRIDPEFLKWAMGSAIDDPGSIPDVEIIYTLPLPSGKEYRFPLKRAKRDSGNLRFFNHDRSYTPADRHVIAGIQNALKDKNKMLILKVLTGTNIDNPSEALAAHLNNPQEITDLAVFEEYEQKRLEGIYRGIEEDAQKPVVNETNKEAVYREQVDKPYIEKVVRQYQDFLRQNPAIAQVKKAYVLPGKLDTEAYEGNVTRVIDHMAAQIQKIREQESARSVSPEEAVRRTERDTLGYEGPAEGFALDVDHVMLDAIQEVMQAEGKKGRSYEGSESRFFDANRLQDFLANPSLDRRYREVIIHDPLAENELQKIQKKRDLNDQSIKQTESSIVNENIKRADKEMQSRISRTAELEAKLDMTSEEKSELRSLKKHKKTEENLQKKIVSLKENIAGLQKEKVVALQAEKDNIKKRALSDDFDRRMLDLKTDLTSQYKTIIGEKIWDRTAIKIRQRVERNIIKFIYVVKSDGSILFDEEKFGGAVTGRAAHSELAGGGNIYGAGELAFEKKKNGSWSLIEVNNGSGHYRPSGKTLTFVRGSLQQLGFDISAARRIDALMRIDLETKQPLKATDAEGINDLSLVE